MEMKAYHCTIVVPLGFVGLHIHLVLSSSPLVAIDWCLGTFPAIRFGIGVGEVGICLIGELVSPTIFVFGLRLLDIGVKDDLAIGGDKEGLISGESARPPR